MPPADERGRGLETWASLRDAHVGVLTARDVIRVAYGGGFMDRPTKSCAVCGRRIEWRKKWERDWASVRYCSSACRTRRVRSVDAELESAIVELLTARPTHATICPSEVARLLGGEEWRELMEPAREAARRLVAEGRIEITQRGVVVDGSTAKGPIRLRRIGH